MLHLWTVDWKFVGQLRLILSAASRLQELPTVEDESVITFEDAMKKAVHYLQDSEVLLQMTFQGEFSEGWYFCFQSKEYMETGNPSAQLAGNAPFLIDRDTGELHALGTAHPLEDYLNEYVEGKAAAKGPK